MPRLSLYASGQVNKKHKPDFEQVFEGIADLQPVHSKMDLNIYNIESVFAKFEMGHLIHKLPGTQSDAERAALISSLRTVIQFTLENLIVFNDGLSKVNERVKIPEGSYPRFADSSSGSIQVNTIRSARLLRSITM